MRHSAEEAMVGKSFPKENKGVHRWSVAPFYKVRDHKEQPKGLKEGKG